MAIAYLWLSSVRPAISPRPCAAMAATHTLWSLGGSRPTGLARAGNIARIQNLTAKPENASLRQIPNVVAVGGVPIKVGKEVIGGVGISGAPGAEKDQVCAVPASP